MSVDLDYLVHKEKYQEMIRAAERDRLLQLAKGHKSDQPSLHRNLIAWTGIQMVKWGSKLQQYGSVSTAGPTSAAQSGRHRDAALL